MSSTSIGFNNLVNALIIWLEEIETFVPGDMQIKKDGSIVTEFDIVVQSKIENLAQRFLPLAHLISEENEREVLPPIPSQVLLIDPVDGTENFASGIPLWGIGLAYFLNNSITSTCVLFPEIKLLNVSKNVNIAISSSFKQLRQKSAARNLYLYPANFQEKDLAGLDGSSQTRILGCSLMNITLASLGSGGFKSSGLGLKTWDFLPAILPAIENGRRVYVNDLIYLGEYLPHAIRYVLRIESNV